MAEDDWQVRTAGGHPPVHNAAALPLRARRLSLERIDADLKICVEEGTFPTLTKIMDCIRRADSYLGAQEEWFKEVFPPTPVLFCYERKTPCSNDVLRASQARDALRFVSNAVKQLSECISLQAEVAEEHVKAFHLRRGMSSMPDEVLALILQDAATAENQDLTSTDEVFDDFTTRTTVQRATKLSHTCQRFRRLLVNLPKLWNCLSNHMPLGMLRSCCDRLVAADAEVHLTDSTFPTLPMSTFLRIVMSRSELWRHFGHHSWEPDEDEINDLAEATDCLNAPSLSSLSVGYTFRRAQPGIDEDEDGDLYSASNYFSTWSMPNLTSFKTFNLIPVPFKNPVSLKFLDISYTPSNGKHLNFRAFARFLSSCEVVEDLTLYLVDGCLPLRLPSPPDKCISLEHVARGHLSFHQCKRNFIRSLLDTFRLPNATSLNISLRLDSRDSRRDCPDGLIDNTLISIFPNASTFPELVELELDFAILGFKRQVQVALPFSSIQAVRRLTLTSNRSILAPISDGHILPSLNSLVMKRCLELDAEWITSFLGRLVNHGKLHPSQLKVKSCAWARSREMRMEWVDATAEEMFRLIK